MMNKSDRYQHQPWYIKVLRWVWWKPRVPWWAFRMWLSNRDDDLMKWKFCVSIAKGLTDARMKHYYDWDEI